MTSYFRPSYRIVQTHRFVYLAPFPKIEALKIGSANDVERRMNFLGRHWGKPDFENLCFISIRGQSCANRFENTLQYMLTECRKDVGYGPGDNEFFEPDAKDKALEIMKLYNRLNGTIPWPLKVHFNI